MTTYKEIFGKYVKNYSSDPTADAEGQVWYNTTSGTFKSVVGLAAWSAASPGITARTALPGGGGTQTAAFVAGGYNGTTDVANTEEYNGSGWSNGGNLNTARYGLGGAGTLTAGLVFGGHENPPDNSTSTEEYDGSAWTAGGVLNTGRRNPGGFGIQTAAVAAGGYVLPNAVANTEEYNGTSWTAGNTMNTARGSMASCGILTAGLGFGGFTGGPPYPRSAATESYNGTSWTTLNSMNTARNSLAGFGTQSSAVAAGGFTPTLTTQTETWDGTNWTTSSATLGTARGDGTSAGNSSAGLYSFGESPSTTAATEEFNFSSTIITAAAWASGGNLSTPRSRHTGFGSQTAAVAASNNPSPRVITEEYNGSSWGSGGNMNTGRQELAGLGTLTAGLAFGGEIGPNTQATEEYDGSTWTNGGNLTSPAGIQAGPSAAGTQTAALQGGGATTTPAPVGVINWSGEYNGSAWTTGNNINTARSAGLGGTQTAGVLAGGGAFPSPIPGFVTENYDGTTWTNSNSQLSPGNVFNIAGPVTNSVWIGIGPNPTTSVHFYDGTTFTTGASYATARSASAGAGDTATAGLIFGGNPGAQIASTEEYNPETTAANVKTITTS
jgi:hypothetical protein